jgi:hypothetical protein
MIFLWLVRKVCHLNAKERTLVEFVVAVGQSETVLLGLFVEGQHGNCYQ